MIFGKKVILHKIVFWFFVRLLSKTFLVLRRTEWKMIEIVCWPSCKVPQRYSCRILMKLEFSGQILEKNILLSNLMRIRPVGTQLFRASRQTDAQTGRQTDRQTDMTKLIVAFSNFANVPKNCTLFWQSTFMFFVRVLGDGATISL
jgi:hypothetical protein